MKNKVSIIVPAYNAEVTIKKCIESILAQSYHNIEVIIVDDGSKDKTYNIIDSYRKIDKRVMLLSIDNNGVSNARNIGIKNANGDFIIFIDSDDYVEKEYVEKLLSCNGEFTICNYNKINNNNVIPNNSYRNFKNNVKDSFNILFNKISVINQPWAKLYDLNLIREKSILFDTNLSIGEDLIFNLNYLKHINIINFIDIPLYNYKIGNKSSLSKKYYENMLNIQTRLKNELIEFCNTKKISEKEKKYIYLKGMKFMLSAVTNEFHYGKFKFARALKILNSNEIQTYNNELYKKYRYSQLAEYLIIKLRLLPIYLIFRKYLFK